MRVGEKVTYAKMAMLFSTREMATGKVTLKHPRCGRVVFKGTDEGWVVTEVERPDPPKKGGAR